VKLQFSDEQRAAFMERAAHFERSRPRLTLRFDDLDLRMDVSTRLSTWRVLDYFTKEPETIAWIATMGEGDVLFDVGANVGLYSVWAAATRPVSVCAFEPEAGNYATLMENLRANKLTDRVQAFCLGVSDVARIGAMEVKDGPAGQSGHQVQVARSAKFHVGGGKSQQGTVTFPLDDLVYQRGLPCPTHLKVDVDGIEHAVIGGARRLIADRRLKSVMIELILQNDFHRPIIDLLVASGFDKDDAMEQAVREKTGGVAFTGNILFTRP
jgi:FkbM family methyltransferase